MDFSACPFAGRGYDTVSRAHEIIFFLEQKLSGLHELTHGNNMVTRMHKILSRVYKINNCF